MGQIGIGALPIWKRYLLIGMWPVRSCVIILAVFLGKDEMR